MKSPPYIFFLGLVIIFLMININLFAQTKEDVASLRQETLQSIQQNGQGYQKFIDYYYSRISVPEMLAIKIKAQLIREEYSNAVTDLFQLKKIVENSKDPRILFEYYLVSYETNHRLGINSEADEYQNQLQNFNPEITKTVAVEFAVDFSKLNFISETEKIKLLNQVAKQYFKDKNYFFASRAYFYLGNIYLSQGNAQFAENNFQKSYRTSSVNNVSSSSQIYSQTGLAKVYLFKKNYAEAYKVLLPLKSLIAFSPDIDLKKQYYEDMALASAFINIPKETEWADAMLTDYKQISEDSKIKGRALLANQLENQYVKKIEYQKNFWNQIFIILIIIFSLIILGAFIFFYIKSQRKSERKKDADPKIFNIPDKTEKELVNKLNLFELSGKFTQKNISLKTLSQQLDTNPRYLSEIVNKHKNANFSTYINELRIDYILKKLKKNPDYRKYKVGYLAEECGFSSHSLFTTVFKNKVGKSPIEYIQDLEKII